MAVRFTFSVDMRTYVPIKTTMIAPAVLWKAIVRTIAIAVISRTPIAAMISHPGFFIVAPSRSILSNLKNGTEYLMILLFINVSSQFQRQVRTLSIYGFFHKVALTQSGRILIPKRNYLKSRVMSTKSLILLKPSHENKRLNNDEPYYCPSIRRS